MIRSIPAVPLLLAFTALAACGRQDNSPSRTEYPATRTVNVVHDYHGTKVPDPYNWLEDLEAKEVRDWAAAQTALALPYLRNDEVLPWMSARSDELNALWSDSATEQKDQEPPLVDEKSLASGESVDDLWVSPDRRYAAYTVTTAGSDWTEGRIRRLADGVDLDERLSGLRWSSMSWTKDGRGFFYERSLKPAPGERTTLKGGRVYYHVVGTPQSRDSAIFALPPDVSDVVLTQEISEDGRFLFISEGNGAHVDGIGWLNTRLHVLDLEDPLKPTFSGTVVALSAERDAAYRIIATQGDSLYLFTDHDAPRRRLVVFGLGTPHSEQWRNVVPPSEDVIDQVQYIDGRFVVTYLRNVQHGVRVYERSGQLVRELPIRPMSVVTDLREGAANELVVEALEQFSPTRRRFDLATGRETVERDVKSPSPADSFEIRQLWFPSKDGVQVPMFVAHRRGLTLDGSHPTIISAYGASSQLELPYFSYEAVPLLELGVVLVAPALRGGGEFGRTWYEAATLERKQTTFDDVIAAAEFLIREKYTSPDRLALFGSSNGGRLVTAVLNQRPDLFRVAVADVPVTDLLRFDVGRHATQHGTSNNPAHIPFLLAYSPLHNVKPGTCYPSTLITTAFNDDNVPAWMALKHAASLQAAQSCDRPVLLRVNTEGGHAGMGKSDGDQMIGFMTRELGVKRP